MKPPREPDTERQTRRETKKRKTLTPEKTHLDLMTTFDKFLASLKSKFDGETD